MTELYRKDFPTTQAAHDALPAEGGTVYFDPITYTKDGCSIEKPNVRFICVDGTATMTYPLDYGSGPWAQLVKSKGIFVTKGATQTATGKYDDFSQAANNFYCEGFEFQNAQISDKNGAGIRGQAKGLTVRRCRFTNCQDGILTGDQIDQQGRVIGWVEMHECSGSNNGYDGMAHDAYIGPCARSIVTAMDAKANKEGHHVKFNPGGGVAINIGGNFPNPDPNPISGPVVHCGTDGTSAHVAVLNTYMRKPDSTDPNSNLAKAMYMSNDRVFSPIGVEWLIIGNMIDSYVQKGKGHFLWAEEMTAMKDHSDTRTPPPILGYAGQNLFRYKKNTAKPNYDYGTDPILMPAGVINENNTVVTVDDTAHVWNKIDLSAAPALTATTMIAFYTYLRGIVPVNAQASIDRTLDALEGFETYDPMEQGGTDAIAKVQADLAAAQIALDAAKAAVTVAQKDLAQVDGLNSRLAAVRASLRRNQAKIESAIAVLEGNPS